MCKRNIMAWKEVFIVVSHGKMPVSGRHEQLASPFGMAFALVFFRSGGHKP